MVNFQKKQVKIISIAIAAVFILSIVALGVAQYKSALSMGGNSSNVGKINMQQVITSSPSYGPAGEKYQQFAQEQKQKLQAELPKMNQEQQQQAMMKMQMDLQAKQHELVQPIIDSANAAVKEVADKKGLSVVVNVDDVLYGGQDITQDVVKVLQKKGDVAATAAPKDDKAAAPAPNASENKSK